MEDNKSSYQSLKLDNPLFAGSLRQTSHTEFHTQLRPSVHRGVTNIRHERYKASTKRSLGRPAERMAPRNNDFSRQVQPIFQTAADSTDAKAVSIHRSNHFASRHGHKVLYAAVVMVFTAGVLISVASLRASQVADAQTQMASNNNQ